MSEIPGDLNLLSAIVGILLAVVFWRAVYMIDILPSKTPKHVSLPWLLLAGASAGLFFSCFPACREWHDPSVAIFVLAVLWLIFLARPECQ